MKYILSNEEDYQESRVKVGSLPSNSDVLDMLDIHSPNPDLSVPSPAPSKRSLLEVFVNTLVVTMWIENGSKTWYIGYITDVGNDENSTIVVDHLHRISKSNHLWAYPKRQDQCEVSDRQVLGIEPQYEWNLESIRNHKMVLKNCRAIEDAINKVDLHTE